MLCLAESEILVSVTDPAHLAIANARVVIKQQGTGALFGVTEAAGGVYRGLGLPPGDYLVSVSAPGFLNTTSSGVTVLLAQSATLAVTLSLGVAAAQSVQVSSTSVLLGTENGALRYTVEQHKIVNLPLDGRNFIPLVALSPGVALPQGSVLPRISGSRPRTNEYLYDGISVLQPEPGQVAFYPIIDGIEEFTINRNAYSPEYGRSNGGTVIVATKAGTNQFHGSLFEFFRNEALNARNLFAPTGPKPEFRRNQYGLAAGGPVQHARTFFFADWQGTRLRTGITRFSTVPSLTKRGVVAPSLSDPLGLAVLNLYPAPNVALINANGTNANGINANNYQRTATEPDNQDQFDLRLDHHFGQRHRLFVRYSYAADDDAPVTPLPDGSGSLTSGVTGHSLTRADAVAAGYSWSVTPGTLNELRFGYTRRGLNRSAASTASLNIPGVPANVFSTVLPTFTVAGYQQLGPSASANSRFTTSVTELTDTLSLVRGNHVVKVGGDMRREALGVVQPPNPAGLYAFTTLGTGDSIASLLLGQVNSFSIDLQPAPLQERAHIAEFFAADEWRVTPRLSLNYGTRYTLNFPSTEANGRGAVFNLNTQLLEFPKTARNLECCNFGPRAGIAYRVGNSTVFRAGYGMVWFEQTGITTPFTLPQFPFIQTVGQVSLDGTTPAFLLRNGPSVQPQSPNPNSGLGQGVFASQRNNGSGYSQQWNATLQQTFGRNWTAEMAYAGSKNTRLGVPDTSLNQLPVTDLALGAKLLAKVPNPYYGQIPLSSSLGAPTIAYQQLLRPYPRFTTVSLFRDNIGHSTYHALQARAEKRFGAGLTLTLAYTFSKLIDDASSVFDASILTGPVANFPVADSFNKRLEKDLSNGDIPHVFSAAWVYEVPAFFRTKPWRITGWHIAGLVRLQSGDTVSVTQSPNFNAFAGFGTQRPNRIANPNSFAARSTSEWFNVAAFTQAPQFTLGTSSRNPVRGPTYQQADIMLGKVFHVAERVSLDFRAEAFNVTNTPPLNDPNGTFGTAAFGTITSAGNPRVFEFALKLLF